MSEERSFGLFIGLAISFLTGIVILVFVQHLDKVRKQECARYHGTPCHWVMEPQLPFKLIPIDPL